MYNMVQLQQFEHTFMLQVVIHVLHEATSTEPVIFDDSSAFADSSDVAC